MDSKEIPMKALPDHFAQKILECIGLYDLVINLILSVQAQLQREHKFI